MLEAEARAALDTAAATLKGASAGQLAQARAAHEQARRRWATFERWGRLDAARADLARLASRGDYFRPRRRVSLVTPEGERLHSADPVALLAALRAGARPQGQRDEVAVRHLQELR